MSANPVGIDRSRDVLGGTPVFTGTRVPVRTLLDYLEAGDSLNEFLADFPTVTREQAVALLERAREALLLECSDSPRGESLQEVLEAASSLRSRLSGKAE